ncbi:MAG UNVERIFIED_CONTAM: hypothetical protein LVQ98_02610 [Rickettsiaceae bacterium]|jgi:hypothetical protein
MPKDNLNDSGIGLDDSIISQDNESDIPYKIFYQSMEYPNTFTKKLASQLGVENGNSPKKGGKATDPKYYEKAESLLSEQFNMGADFVVLGEYYDPREIGTEAEGYRVVGKVGETTRAMTIYCTTKKEIPGARVTSLDGQKIDIQYIDKEYGESRGVNIEDSRKRLSEVSKSSTKHIGKFIELMIYNRYMLFVHVRDTGSKAQTNIANSFESGLPGIYVLAGDLNLGITGKNTHDIESPMGRINLEQIQIIYLMLIQRT